MTLSRVFEYRSVRLALVFLMIFALALTLARPAHAVAVTSILIPAVIATLGAWGIGTAVDGLNGDDIAEWFHEKLTSWETAAGIVLENIAIGIKMTPLGQVLLNPIALAGVREFGSWLVQNEGLVAGGSSAEVISGGITFNGYQVWTSADISWSNGLREVARCEGCYLLVNASSSWTRIVGITMNRTGAHLYVDRYADGQLFQSLDLQGWDAYNGQYWLSHQYNLRCSSADPPVVNYTYEDVFSSSGGVQSGDGSMSLVPSAEMDVPKAADVQDKELLLNTSLDVGADAASWYDGVMQKVAANDLTVTGTLTQAGTITADQVLDQGAIREEDGVVVWPDVVQPIGVTGLDDIFPFCIPFDIYHFCEALAAEPVAPSFDVPFYIEGIVDYTFHLDLADFDDVAALLRTLELLLFIVGLAYATRSKFIRG